MEYKLVSKETCAKIGNVVISIIMGLFAILALIWKFAD
jgi:hypothetical protein